MTYAAEVIADSPAIYWEFEDANGTTVPVDSSGNGRNAAISGGFVEGFGQPALFSGLGTSLGLVGTGGSNYIHRNHDAVLDVGTGDFCVEYLMICNNDTSNYVEILARDDGATGNGIIFYLQTGTGAARIWCGGSVAVGTRRISDGVAHWIVLQRVSGVVTLFIDGLPDFSTTMAGSVTLSSSGVRVGVVDGSYHTLNGYIQHVSWYPTHLSNSRLSAHGSELGIYIITENPNQGVMGHIYENVGFNVKDNQEGYGYIDENVGFNVQDAKEGYGYIYEDIIIPTMRTRIGIPIR